MEERIKVYTYILNSFLCYVSCFMNIASFDLQNLTFTFLVVNRNIVAGTSNDRMLLWKKPKNKTMKSSIQYLVNESSILSNVLITENQIFQKSVFNILIIWNSWCMACVSQ